MPIKDISKNFSDGSHRWGWLINLVAMLLAFAYFQGHLEQRITNLESHQIKMQEQLDKILNITRGTQKSSYQFLKEWDKEFLRK